MKILVAIDSFKGSATSKELNEALLDGLTDERITEKISVPIADGGEGTMQSVQLALGGAVRTKEVPDLTGKPMHASYLITKIDSQETAIIETAEIIGIDKIIPNEKTIFECSTVGLGLLIKKIIEDEHITKFYLTLGGSGTSDGGLGLLSGLGGKLNFIEGTNPLYSAKTIDLTSVQQIIADKKITFIALADVTNPYIGPTGFSHVFGPQKGGQQLQLEEMDLLAKKVSDELTTHTGIPIAHVAGAGAAGGLGGAILALGGTIVPGFQTISEILNLEQKIAEVDLVITGEGKIDQQTQNGKVPYGIACLAQKYSIPTIALCGARTKDIGKLSTLLLGAFSIQLGPITLTDALQKERTLSQIRLVGSSLVSIFLEGGDSYD